MKPAVSVLLPFLHETDLLRQAATSILTQSLSELELVLIDNGAGRQAAAIARSLGAGDPRVRIIREPGGGIVAALNAGIAQARAAHIARMDADDIALPQRLEQQCEFLGQHPAADAVSCLVEPLSERPLTEGARRYFAWVNASVSPDSIRRDLYIESPLPHPSMMIRTAAIRSLGGYRAFDGPEDYELWLRMSRQGMRFGKVNKTLLYWRQHPGSLSRRSMRYRDAAFDRLRFDHVIRELCDRLLTPNRIVRIWGAGKKGGALARAILAAGIGVESFIDIDPAKIGGRRRELPVYGPESVGDDDRDCFYLAAVGSWNARDLIRAQLVRAGKREERDFIIL